MEFESGKMTTFVRDAAGNVISRNDGIHTVTMTYDPLNRIVNRFVPHVTYNFTSCLTNGLVTDALTGDCFFKMPDRGMNGNVYGAAVCFSSDTATFGYDVAGNLIRADNGDARVRRGYYPNGQVQWDTLRTRQTYRGVADECGGVAPAPPPVDSLGICGDDTHGQRPCNITMALMMPDREVALAGPVVVREAGAALAGPNADDDPGAISSLRSPATLRSRSLESPPASSMAPDSEYTHVYGIGYGYNEDGQRSVLYHPTGAYSVSGCSSACTQSYTYDATTGELTGTTDLHGLSYTIDYDNAGRAYRRTSPGGVTDTKYFDADGNVSSIYVRDASDNPLSINSMTRDNIGRIHTGSFEASFTSSPTESVTMMYHGLGSVIGMETSGSIYGIATEAFTVDGLGNRLMSWRVPTQYNDADPATARVMTFSSDGRLWAVRSPKNDSTGAYTPYFYEKDLDYDGAGNLLFTFMKEQSLFGGGGGDTLITFRSQTAAPEVTPLLGAGRVLGPMDPGLDPGMDPGMDPDIDRDIGVAVGSGVDHRSGGDRDEASYYTAGLTQTAEAHYYDGENHLRLFNRHNGIDQQSTLNSAWAYEEYRYDALGRRVWRRMQGTPQSYVSRTVWDGDEYLYETISSSNAQYGLELDSAVVGYVNADGLDAPVGVWRGGWSGAVGTLVPHVDWRGSYAFGTWEDGAVNPCNGGSGSKCSYIGWPATGMSVARGHPLDATLGAGYWMGSLLSESTDGSGMQYKRNRYYDPASGRFTQVDPIGLAGGLNAYGFAGGDPVNYSDPFGLCPPWPDCIAQGIANWGAQRGGTVGAIALNGGAALNAGFEATGINDAARGGEAIGNGQYKAAAGFLALTFGGEAFKGAKLLKNVHGGSATVDEVLRGAEKWLGEGYRELDEGVFRSADGTRQFRMTTRDLADKNPHVHFESISKNGKTIEQNAHVYLQQ